MKNLTYWRQYRAFSQLSLDKQGIVFYSEGRSYWPYLGPIVKNLLDHYNYSITYVSSNTNDPGLTLNHPKLNSFCIGTGFARTLFFTFLNTKLLVMTMPDLNQFHIKRAKKTLHYAYIHHSINSLHMVYREGAFDHFDSLFCVGPHHLKEARLIEKHYQLPHKQLIEHGYGRLDNIIASKKISQQSNTPPLILLAPSWGKQGILETLGETLCKILLDNNYKLIVRPHPETRYHSGEILDSLYNKYSTYPNFSYEEDITSQDSLHNSDIMISDWSGAAFDYAFGLEKPVLFIDVPRKVNNPNYKEIPTEPLEVSIREKIGKVVSPTQLHTLPAAIETLLLERKHYAKTIVAERAQWIYNTGYSGKVAAKALIALYESL